MDPGYRAEVAATVDAVLREDRCIVEILLPDPDPAQLVTDDFDLFHSILHRIMHTWRVTR
jgi:hypothetical protein